MPIESTALTTGWLLADAGGGACAKAAAFVNSSRVSSSRIMTSLPTLAVISPSI